MTSNSACRDAREHRLLMIFLAAMFVALQLIVGHQMGGGLFGGDLAGPDSYARAVRAVQLWETGHWFDPRLMGVGESGQLQHWTRPLDLAILLGGLVFLPFFGSLEQAVLAFSTIWAPLLHGGLAAAMIWALTPMFDRQRMVYVALLLMVQFYLSAHFVVGKLDWHNLILLAGVGYVGFTVRMLKPRRRLSAGLGAGALGGFMVWAAPESLVLFLATIAVTGLYWAANRSSEMARAGAAFGCAAFAAVAVGHLLERGELWSGMEFDRISGLYLFLFASLAAFWLAALAFERTFGARAGTIARFAFGACAAAAVGAAFFSIHPQVLRGGLTPGVSQLYISLRVRELSELRQVFSFGVIAEKGLFAAVIDAWFYIAAMLVALPALVWLVFSERGWRRWVWIYFGIGFVLLLRNEMKVELKTIGQLSLFALPVCAEVLGRIWDRLERRAVERAKDRVLAGDPRSGHPVDWDVEIGSDAPRRLLVLGVFLIAFVGLPALSFMSAQPDAASGNDIADVRLRLPEKPDNLATAPARPVSDREAETGFTLKSCDVQTLAPTLREFEPTVVMTYASAGPEILFRTEHTVLSMPNHRHQPGFELTHRAFAAEDFERARDLVRDSGAGLVALCLTPPLARFQAAMPGQDTFGAALATGNPPAWLDRVELPEAARIAGFRLYAVPSEGGSR